MRSDCLQKLLGRICNYWKSVEHGLVQITPRIQSTEFSFLLLNIGVDRIMETNLLIPSHFCTLAVLLLLLLIVRFCIGEDCFINCLIFIPSCLQFTHDVQNKANISWWIPYWIVVAFIMELSNDAYFFRISAGFRLILCYYVLYFDPFDTVNVLFSHLVEYYRHVEQLREENSKKRK